MKQIRIKINDLIDQHGATFGNCPGCSICIEIHNLKDRLLEEPVDRFSSILKKGQDMTRSDIVFLLENEVRKKDIRKALGMTTNLFTELLKNLGLSFEKNMNPKGVKKEMPKITHNEYRDLKAQGLSDKDIATRKVMAASYLSTLKKQWNQEDESVKSEENVVSEVTKKPDDKTSEYASLIADLQAKVLGHEIHIDKLEQIIEKYSNKEAEFEAELARKDARILELEGSLVEAQNQIAYLNAACDDVENEADLKELETLRIKAARLEAEINPIRQLAFLKLKQDVGQ